MHLGETYDLRGRADQTTTGPKDVVAVHPGKTLVHFPDKVSPVPQSSLPIHHGDDILYLRRRECGGGRIGDHGLAAVGAVRVLHAQRRQDVLLDVLDIGLTGPEASATICPRSTMPGLE